MTEPDSTPDKAVRQSRNQAGARTFLSAARWSGLWATGVFGGGGRSGVAADKNVRAPSLFVAVLLALIFLGALFWAKGRDPFQRLWFKVRVPGSTRAECIVVLPKTAARPLPVVIYLYGSGGSLMGSGNELRQMAEMGLAAVGMECEEKEEDRGQRTEDRGQRAEDRGQRTEGRGQRTEGRGQRTEGRGQRTEGRGQRAEGRSQGLGVLSTRSSRPCWSICSVRSGRTRTAWLGSVSVSARSAPSPLPCAIPISSRNCWCASRAAGSLNLSLKSKV